MGEMEQAEKLNLWNMKQLREFMASASLKARLHVGERILEWQLKRAFRIALPYFKERPFYTCRHSDPFVPLFRRVPDAWMAGSYARVILEMRRRAQGVDEFDVIVADAQCPQCRQGAKEQFLSGKDLLPWEEERMRELLY